MTCTDSTPLWELNRLMKSVPNFSPRGHGVMILCKHEYSAKDCDCKYCLYHTGKGRKLRCGLDKCACLKERIAVGAASYREVIFETMSAIHYPPFVRRLNQHLKRSEEHPMNYRNEKHQATFTEAVERLDHKNYALMSALYLLTADHRLWMVAKRHTERNEIHMSKDIFADDLHSVYEKQTEHRDALRLHSRELIAEIVSKINSGVYDNPAIESKLTELADRLSKTSGKKQYGYLKADVKAIVNAIVSELAADERIAALYDLWYERREEVIRTYTDELPERIPLVDNAEFKSVKNAVIQEAMNISADHMTVEEQEEQLEDDDLKTEPRDDEIEKEEYDPAPKTVQRSRMWQLYRKAKDLLDKDSNAYDPDQAVELLIESAELGCGVAKYRLGKIFLRGEDVPKNIDYALRWLEESAAEDNPYAEYLLGKTFLKGEDVEPDVTRAESLLRRSSDQGNRYASYTLGKALLDGQLLLQDIPEAIRLLTDSADKGFPTAQYQIGRLLYRGEVIPQDIARAIEYLECAAANKNPYAAYLAGKIRLTEVAVKDMTRAIRNFEIAAEKGNDYAEYQLGKLYLYGKDVERDYDKAIAYLSAAAEHGNQYADQLLHSIQSNRHWSAAMGAIRLLHHLSRMIQNQLEAEKKDKAGAIDRKLKRKIDEKKQAHGLKQG